MAKIVEVTVYDDGVYLAGFRVMKVSESLKNWHFLSISLAPLYDGLAYGSRF